MTRRPKDDKFWLFFLLTAAPIIAAIVLSVYLQDAALEADEALLQGTQAAIAGAAAVDLRRARRALEGGQAAAGEELVAKAQDRIDSPKARASATAAVADGMRALEQRHGTALGNARRTRIAERLSREGAETTSAEPRAARP